MSDSSNTIQVITACYIFLLYTFSLLFLLLLGFTIYRFIESLKNTKHTQNSSNNFLASIFCILTGMICLFSSYFYCFYSTQSILNYSVQADEIDLSESYLLKTFNNSNYIPDAFMFLLFCIVMSQYIIYQKYAHLKRGQLNIASIQITTTYKLPFWVKTLLAFYILFQILIIFLYNIEIIVSTPLNIIDMFVNGIQPICFVGYFIYSTYHFQGLPIKQKKAEENLKHLQIMLIYFSLSRICQCIVNLMMIKNQQYAYVLIFEPQNTSLAYISIGCYALDKILFWLVPLTISMQSTFQQILKKQFEDDKKLISLDNSEVDMIETERQQVERKFSVTDHNDQSILDLKEEDLILTNQLTLKSRGTIQLGILFMGKITKPKYEKKEFVCRKIQVNRISQYLLEEIDICVQNYKKLSNKYIQPIKGIVFQQDYLIFILPYFTSGNMAQYIHGELGEIPKTEELRLDYLLQIAEGMNYLHSQDPPICHGCLSPYNILIHSKTGKIKILDFGLEALKKYISLTTGYTTKSQYSSPEQLKERSPAPIGTKEGDVYAFGMIAWEIFHDTQAFCGTNVQELIKLISDEQKRPKINEGVPERIKILIRSCWQQEAAKRPTFQQIVESLSEENTVNLSIN